MPRRIPLVLVPILLGLLGLWLWGRAPTDYVLHRECERYHAYRRAQVLRLRRELAKASVGLPGLARGPLEARMRLLAFLREHERLRLRGWEVVLVPAGAVRPGAEDFLRVLTWDPSRPGDPREVRGPMEVWVAPRGRLARWLHALGLSP